MFGRKILMQSSGKSVQHCIVFHRWKKFEPSQWTISDYASGEFWIEECQRCLTRRHIPKRSPFLVRLEKALEQQMKEKENHPMTAFDRVSALVKQRAGQPICDDCAASQLGFGHRQQANAETRMLGNMPGYERRVDCCTICSKIKKTIRTL